MSRRQKDPLRPLSDAERLSLSRLSRSQSAPAAQVARARAVLAVADGQSYAMATELVGRATGDTVARWVPAFNRDGLVAVKPRHGGGPSVRYGGAEQGRIRAEGGRGRGRAAAHPGGNWPGAGAGTGWHGALVAAHATACAAPTG